MAVAGEGPGGGASRSAAALSLREQPRDATCTSGLEGAGAAPPSSKGTPRTPTARVHVVAAADGTTCLLAGNPSHRGVCGGALSSASRAHSRRTSSSGSSSYAAGAIGLAIPDEFAPK